jgi:cephalosporin-C deacetylase-like acetyl esterase
VARLSRRDLAKATVALAAARALPIDAQNSAPAYIGPLTGIAAGLEGRRFDPVAYALERLAATPRKLGFSATSREQAEEWQQALRAKVTELIGGLPAARPPLRPVTLETREFPAYRRDKVVFDSAAGVSVLAYVLVPAGRSGPAPTMICIPGHGRGVDDIVGIDEKGQDRIDKAGYQHDFALQVVEAGMAAVAIEPMGFGCRRDDASARRGVGQKACDPVAGAAMLIGQTLLAWRVWDVMRAIDYIETRQELDANRVGCMGISGGGTVTVFASALEPRIRAALVSGYLNTFRDSISSLVHCTDNYVPGILDWAEMHDVAGLIAPRPLFVESGEKDNIFPIAASIASFNAVRDIYAVFGAADRVEQEVFPDAHSFHGLRGIPFLARHLGRQP